MAENQNTHFILENNPSNLKLIEDYFNGNKEFAVRIAKDPWIFNGNELKDLKEIPFDDLETSYGIDFIFDQNLIQFNFNKNIIEIVHAVDINSNIDEKHLLFSNLLKKAYSSSNAVIAGFETTIIIGDFENSITNLISDTSMYPLYVKGVTGARGTMGRFYDFEIFSNSGKKTVWERRLETYLTLIL